MGKNKRVKKNISHSVDKLVKNALIIENCQNCFFSGGSMGFIKKSKKEKEFIKSINKLINLVIPSPEYSNSGKSGIDNNSFDTGSRKNYFFDIIIFTQIANSPDHYSFSSHHSLRNKPSYNNFYVKKKSKKFISYQEIQNNLPNNRKIKLLEKNKSKKIFLLPDYALTDGSDIIVKNGQVLRGIDFHPDLDLSSLYRPNTNLDKNVFINKPEYFGRGYIVTKSGLKYNEYSAFRNSNNNKTNLSRFLKKNGISSLYVCGMGREDTIKRTMIDSLKYKFISDRYIIYDTTLPIMIKQVKKENKVAFNNKPENEWTNKLEEKGILSIITESLVDTENLSNNQNKKSGPLNPLEDLFSKKKNIQINSRYDQNNLNLL